MNLRRWRTAAGAVGVVALMGGGSLVGSAFSSQAAGDTATVVPSVSAATAAASTTCTNPSFVTSAPLGGQTFGGYYLYNNEWNASGHGPPQGQTMYVCNYNNWYEVADWTDNGSHAVLTYPNVQANFRSVPISSFSTLTSTFAETDPHVGIYEDAYDMWINGLATAGSTEMMIWTNNFGQTPSGSLRATATLDGRLYRVYQGGRYIAFVAATNFTSGTMNMLPFYGYAIAHGWMPATSVLNQIGYGVELVSTGGTAQTFTFNNFSVSSSVTPSIFSPRPGAARNIAAGANGAVWVVGTNPVGGGFGIYEWTGSGWAPVAGGAVGIAVGPDGSAWVVNSNHRIYHRVGTGWVQLPGAATDLAVGANGAVWVVGTNPAGGGFGIYEWTGSGWARVAGGAVGIAVGPDGSAWVVNSSHQIYHRVGAGWAGLPGAATDLAVGANGAVWVVGTNPVAGGFGVYHWTGSAWAPVGGGAMEIAVLPNGHPWVVNASQHIYGS
jgi:hypothetical protein